MGKVLSNISPYSTAHHQHVRRDHLLMISTLAVIGFDLNILVHSTHS